MTLGLELFSVYNNYNLFCRDFIKYCCFENLFTNLFAHHITPEMLAVMISSKYNSQLLNY